MPGWTGYIDDKDIAAGTGFCVIGLVCAVAIGVAAFVYKTEKENEMAEVSSLAQLMKANARLKKHAEVAKKTVAVRDYAGPAGEVVTTYQKVAIISKDGKIYVILDFKVDGSVSGQEDWNSARIGILHGLNDDDRSTAEQKLDYLMMDIQKLGIDTASLTLEQIDAALKGLQGKSVKIHAVPGKKDKSKLYYNIIGLAAAAETPSFSSEESEDEWQEELAEAGEEAAEETTEASDADYNPSDWVGYEVTYKNKTVKVVDADDDDGTVTLEWNGKKITVAFSDVTLPE